MHLPTLAALFLLSSPGMLEALATFGVQTDDISVSPHERLERCLEDQLNAELKRAVGGVPVAQLRQAVEALKCVTPGKKSSLLEGALLQLSGRFLCWSRGEVRFRADHLLELQEALDRLLPDQLLAYALQVRCLETDPPTGKPRDLDQASLDDWLVGRLLPAADFPLLHLLEERGVPELHRHDSLSSLPILRWSYLMRHPGHSLTILAQKEDGWQQLLRVEELTNQRLSDLLEKALQLREYLQKLEACTCPRQNPPDDSFTRSGDSRSQAGGPELTDAGGGKLRRLLKNLDKEKSVLERLDAPLPAVGSLLENLGAPGASTGPYAHARAGESEHRAERAFLACLARSLAERGCRDPELRAGIHAYLVIQNLWVRAFIQSRHQEKGLERFVSDYARDVRHKEIYKPGYAEKLAQAWDSGRISHLELRIGPGGEAEKATDLRSAVRKRSNPASLLTQVLEPPPLPMDLRDPADKAPVPAIGIIVHFLKGDDAAKAQPTGELLPEVRFAGKRRKLRDEALALARAMSDPGGGHALVGLDVASLETAQPIEVFAPAFRYLRRPYHHKEPLDRLLVPNAPERSPLGMTCHAGEEFHHLLTGLRAMDETVRFLELQAGDRLGHGLALGLAPSTWASRFSGSLRMKRGEVLDDLVWFHDRLVGAGGAGKICRELEAQVAGFASQIYLADRTRHRRPAGLLPSVPGIELLFRAWQFRGEDPLVEPPPSLHADPAQFGLVPDDLFLQGLLEAAWVDGGRDRRERARKEFGEDAEQLWWSYLTAPEEWSARDKIIEVALKPHWFDAMAQVQDAMITEFAGRGLVIEANPTSNLCIGPLDELTQHPIFRWSGPDMAPGQGIPVVVGSDDPAIFGTELIHEYAFLGAAALKLGFTVDKTVRWLERLRDTGLRYTFIRPPQRSRRKPPSWGDGAI